MPSLAYLSFVYGGPFDDVTDGCAGSGGGQPACPRLEVTGADYADCNGEYELSGERVDWAPQRFVFKHVSKDRSVIKLGFFFRNSELKNIHTFTFGKTPGFLEVGSFVLNF